jgi:DNA-binding transcriptional MerR regulator
MRIGEIARACEVSVDTIRHYEREGVIPASIREANGYRRFPDNTIDRVRVVRRALSIGFTLKELSRIFRDRAQGKAPCGEVQALAKRKLVDIETRMREMEIVRDTLVATISKWDARLEETGPGELARLLDSLLT